MQPFHIVCGIQIVLAAIVLYGLFRWVARRR